MIRALDYSAVVVNHDPFLRRVVGKMWTKYHSVRASFGDRDDALQTARLELVRAAKRYDYGGTANFETYAGKYVRRGILRESRRLTRQHLTNTRMDDIAEDTQDDVIDSVQCAFLKLSQQDQDLLAKRFGMHGQEESTSLELSELLGVARRTTQKHVQNALERLKKIITAGA